MEHVLVDFSKVTGNIKPMHGVNSGPFQAGSGLGNKETFREAGFPYVRNHDSSASLFYFGERSNDVAFIFPNFDADENDPANYDFHYTDRFVRHTTEAGAAMLFRLGSKIEGGDKHYNILPPKDYAKYARICEHIISHYCYGWNDGMNLPIQYWEIWCEPENPHCWFGTFEEFLPFYEAMAKHLKSRFPTLSIGGPGFTHSHETEAGKRNYPEEFVQYLHDHEVPCDFFSWHYYTDNVKKMEHSVCYTRDLLNRYGFDKTELILDEWNLVYKWGAEGLAKSYLAMATEEGAAFYAAMILCAQKTELDQFLYYDVRPDCSFNGLFAPYVFTPLKGYYSFWQFNQLYRIGKEVYSESSCEDIYTGAAGNGDRAAVQIAYRKAEAEEVAVTLKNLPENRTISCRLVDREHTNEKVWSIGGTSKEMTVTLTVQPSSSLLLMIE